MIAKKVRYWLLVAVALLCCATSLMAGRYRVADIHNVQLQDGRRFVTNPDGIITAHHQATLDSLCYALKAQGLAEVAIVAVEDIYPRDILDFAQSLFEGWGVGDDSLDNGLGILLVEDMREIRFHTGYGVEGVLTDAMCYRIQQEVMIPHFRRGDYSQGMVEGMRAVATLLEGGDLPHAEAESDDGAMWIAFIVTLFLVVVPIAMLLIYEYRRTKCPHCKRHKLLVVKTERMHLSTGAVLLVETLRCTHCDKEVVRQRRDNDHHRRGGGGMPIFFPMGGSRGGGFGGGGFGGGGFGGGSFGGGGSSSSW